MTSFLNEYLNTKRRQKRGRRIWKRMLRVFSIITVFCTTYALILPAITWERSLVCVIPEHRHSGSCYETVTVPAGILLICGMEEHAHGDGCYNEAGGAYVPYRGAHT